jgi:hypothetical protein
VNRKTLPTELATRAAASVTTGGTPDPGGTPGAGGYKPGSLHKGELGIAVPAADLTRPEIASMPFFGSMR